jgi:hypothetical protein
MASKGTEYYHILIAQGFVSALGVSMVFQPCKYYPPVVLT